MCRAKQCWWGQGSVTQRERQQTARLSTRMQALVDQRLKVSDNNQHATTPCEHWLNLNTGFSARKRDDATTKSWAGTS